MKAKELEDLILDYKVYCNKVEKEDKIIIPRMTPIIYNVIAATNEIPNEIAVHSLFHDYSLGAIKFNLDRSLRNLHLCCNLMESDKELPTIAASSGSADFIMGGIPFKVCLNDAQFESLSEEFRNEVNCIVLEDWKANVKTVNGVMLFTDISATIVGVAEEIRKMMKRAKDADSKDPKREEGVQPSIH